MILKANQDSSLPASSQEDAFTIFLNSAIELLLHHWNIILSSPQSGKLSPVKIVT